jgi:hypothetical protein
MPSSVNAQRAFLFVRFGGFFYLPASADSYFSASADLLVPRRDGSFISVDRVARSVGVIPCA